MKTLLKHTLLFLLLVTIIEGCNPNATSKTEAGNLIKTDTAAFMAAFKKMNFDTFFVTTNYDSLQNQNYYLYGTALDTGFGYIFPDTIRRDALNFSQNPNETFAVGRFDIDAVYEGYLLRHRGEEFPSSFTLLIFDKKNRRFLGENLEVGESWGDAGDEVVINGVLRQKNGKLEIDLHKQGSGYEPSDTTLNTLIQMESIEKYQLNRGHIARMSETVLKCDTVYMGSPSPADTTAGVAPS